MSDEIAAGLPATTGSRIVRIFSWTMVGFTFVYLLNNWLIYWQDWQEPSMAFVAPGLQSILLIVFYLAAFALAVAYVLRTDTPLRVDSLRMTAIVTFLIRWAFWTVLLIGLIDAAISFLRVEDMLDEIIGPGLSGKMNFNASRAPLVHGPLILVALVCAVVFRRTLGFHWLALLVVLAELAIVLSRFIFSYEQAFMGDLVRFWYGALFLFASAYTLLEDGHVRVDVLYAGFRDRTRGFVNAWGSILLGIIFCWVILTMGMTGKNSLINAPIISLEVSQAGFGMYVKYLMAGFLAVFAVTMNIQFSAYLMESYADWRGDPGSRLHKHDDELPAH